MRGAGFFAIGNISIDDLVFADGATMWCVPGGNSIYSALGMAVWGERPDVIAPVGPEYPTAKLCDRINLGQCRLIERNLRNWGLYEEDGTRHFIFRSKTRNWLDFSPSIDDLGDGPFPYSHLAPLPWRLQLELASALRERGASLISVDLDDRRLAEVPIGEVAELLALVDLFMPSRQDVAEIFPGRTPLDALKALRELSPDTPVIAVKCGAQGAIAHQRDETEYLSSPSAARTRNRRDRRGRRLLRRRAGRIRPSAGRCPRHWRTAPSPRPSPSRRSDRQGWSSPSLRPRSGGCSW